MFGATGEIMAHRGTPNMYNCHATTRHV